MDSVKRMPMTLFRAIRSRARTTRRKRYTPIAGMPAYTRTVQHHSITATLVTDRGDIRFGSHDAPQRRLPAPPKRSREPRTDDRTPLPNQPSSFRISTRPILIADHDPEADGEERRDLGPDFGDRDRLSQVRERTPGRLSESLARGRGDHGHGDHHGHEPPLHGGRDAAGDRLRTEQLAS